MSQAEAGDFQVILALRSIAIEMFRCSARYSVTNLGGISICTLPTRLFPDIIIFRMTFKVDN